MVLPEQKLRRSEKLRYALGDGAANIAWRGVATFLFIYYTDVFGISPVTVGILMLIARSSDGIIDIIMGIICDRTDSRYGKFRPWILWTAIPLGITLSLLFTSPNLSPGGKVVYAYVTYLLFFLMYTANNIPYGALMAVMTGDDKERTSIGSYRMVGAFTGGMLVQGALLFLVVYFGNVNPEVGISKIGSNQFKITVASHQGIRDANLKTKSGIASVEWADSLTQYGRPSAPKSVSFSMQPDIRYAFVVTGEGTITQKDITLIDQKKGYSRSIYVMSIFLSLFLLLTFAGTRERIKPPKEQGNNLRRDLKDLIKNRPWLVLLIIGMLFNVYNSIKQGIVVIYFTHYLHNQLLAASYMVALMLASIGGAMITSPLSRKVGKKNLFIYALIFSAAVNALLYFCRPADIIPIFTLGVISEFGAAIFPTLFFVMLGDAADYSEFVNNRRATGLVYSAGSFATKFGGGIAGAIIGMVLSLYHYNGMDPASIQGATAGIVNLMSWIPALVALCAAGVMAFFPLNQAKMNEITAELADRRLKESAA